MKRAKKLVRAKNGHRNEASCDKLLYLLYAFVNTQWFKKNLMFKCNEGYSVNERMLE